MRLTEFSYHFSFLGCSNNSNGIKDDRQKRGVLELYSMVKCSTGCDPLIYKGYGCYCGFLGRGRALDGIDRYGGVTNDHNLKLNGTLSHIQMLQNARLLLRSSQLYKVSGVLRAVSLEMLPRSSAVW